MDPSIIERRYQDFRHYFRVRVPLEEGEDMNIQEEL